jgi:peptidoglycan/LPS O-acetylase OafA/YrhL
MSLAISIYLDLFRMLAALAVFLSHTAGTRLTGFLYPKASSFGGEAVAAFFVLSGFVIGYVADTRETSPRAYAISRLARLYSVAFPAIAVTLVADALGRVLQPDLYVGAPGYWVPTTWATFLSSVLFVTELWSAHVHLGTDGAYWSLGFEVWYYVLFGLVVFLRRMWRIAAIILWLMFVGPRVAAAFPVWLLGYAAYAVSKMKIPAPWFGFCLFTATSWLYLPYHLNFGQPFGLDNPRDWSFSTLLGYAYNYGLGLLICLHLVGFSIMSELVSGVALKAAKPVRWLAGATFTFYLMHMPVALLLCALCPWPPESTATRLIVIGGTPLVILLLAELGERRKAWWRRLFALLLSPGRKLAI